MPLRITLKPFERLFINGAAICNGDRSATFLMETQCRFLRESEVILESDADTPCRKLCVTVQAVYMTEPGQRTALEALLVDQARAIATAAPSLAPTVSEVLQLVAEDKHHRALKRAKAMVDDEGRLLASVRHAA